MGSRRRREETAKGGNRTMGKNEAGAPFVEPFGPLAPFTGMKTSHILCASFVLAVTLGIPGMGSPLPERPTISGQSASLTMAL